MQEVLVNRLGGLSLSRKSEVRLTDRPDMTSAVYHGLKTTKQQLLLLVDCHCTLKCLNIGTPKPINFPFVPNGKLMIFMCPIILAHYNTTVLCPNFGTPKNN